MNAGPNGVVDPAGANPFSGDDFPLISALISFPGMLNTGVDSNGDDIDDPFAVLPVFDTTANVAWAAPTLFNGQFQLTGSAVAAPGALTISETPTAIMRIDTGLTAADFGTVSIETGYSYAFAAGSGGTLFSNGDALATGAFHIGDCLVPEPGATTLLAMGLVGFLGLRRRS